MHDSFADRLKSARVRQQQKDGDDAEAASSSEGESSEGESSEGESSDNDGNGNGNGDSDDKSGFDGAMSEFLGARQCIIARKMWVFLASLYICEVL